MGESNNPLVSVITIFLNCEDFIEEAIESVLVQTYDQWELLLVDDGSTDRSTEVARRYAQQYPGRLRYLEHEAHCNRGTGASRNLGISYSRGEYIAFLDADDVWFPETLETMVSVLRSHRDAGMVFGPTQYWYTWDESSEDTPPDHITEVPAPSDVPFPPGSLSAVFLQSNLPPPATCSMLVRRAAISRVGGFKDSFRGLYEDQALLVKLFLKESSCSVTSCLSRYRRHPRSICSTALKAGYIYGKPHPIEEAFLRWTEQYFRSQGVTDPHIWRSLGNRLWPYRHPVLYRLYAAVAALSDLIGVVLGWLQYDTTSLQRWLLQKPTGWIDADPHRIIIHDRSGVGKTTLRWASSRASDLEVRVNAPDGPLFARSGPVGSQSTDRNVVDGTVFYLQDVSEGRPLTPGNTVARVKIDVIVRPESQENSISKARQSRVH